MESYDHKAVEKKWQKRWREEKVFSTQLSRKASAGASQKMYILDMFPYPSGSGLHVGHPKGYIATDIFSRYHRMKGFRVLHPMGWDAFGLPAENYAIQNKVHPRAAVEANVKRFKEQLSIIGFDYDWEREINTTDPAYYKWTQWIFLQLFKKELAYQSNEPVNWCPKDKTVLANEDVENGVCERCGTLVERRAMRQWVLKITDYGDKLLEGLETLDWPESIKTSQRNWIGKSEGAQIDFAIDGSGGKLTVFTTRPDTIFGATYMVVAPEHSLIQRLGDEIENYSEVQKYIEQASHKTDLQRQEGEKEKTGVELKGVLAVNPANNEKIPVWVADYVLPHYGTGAIMAVPAHDERDLAFAKKFGLPIAKVITPSGSPSLEGERPHPNPLLRKERGDHGVVGEVLTGTGVLVNSDEFNGLENEAAKKKITNWLEKKGVGKGAVNYKLQDWVFSRQRYWGEPIPIIHCEKCGTVPVPEEDLPVKLPEVENYEPTGTGESPLANIDSWVNVACPRCASPAKRETNTMPQWAGSSWYYLAYIMRGMSDTRFPMSKYKKAFEDWLPVDMYVGGAEHATRHLIYARFWHRFLYDEGHVSTPEPFMRLQHVGLIAGEDGRKMSKRWGNVINPDDVVAAYGADAFRLYEMFMGPFNQGAVWSTAGIAGTSRFVKRVWRVMGRFITPSAISPSPEGERPHPSPLLRKERGDHEVVGEVGVKLHQTIKRVTESTEHFRFNVAVAAFMEFLNELEKQENVLPAGRQVSKETLETFVKLLSPYAPHIAEELWEKLGNNSLVAQEVWPQWDEEVLAATHVSIPVQVNGKVRAVLVVDRGLSQDEIEKLARADENVTKFLATGDVKKVIYRADKLLNFVVS